MATPPSTTSLALSLVVGIVFTFMGVVETFVTLDPGSRFGPMLLAFGPAMLLFWRSGKTGDSRVRVAANVLAGIAVTFGLLDIVRDIAAI